MAFYNLPRLTLNDDAEFNEEWKKFFYNYEAVVALLKTEPEENVKSVLAAGERWLGTGWNTTTAAKTLRQLTGVALVRSQFKEYLSSFLYSLALVTGIEVSYLDLSAEAAKAAFALADVWHSDFPEGDPAEARLAITTD